MKTCGMEGHRIIVNVERFYGWKYPHEGRNATARLNRLRVKAREVTPGLLEDVPSVALKRNEERKLRPTRSARCRWRILMCPGIPSAVAAGLVRTGRLMVFGTRSATRASGCASLWLRRPGTNTIW